MIRFSALALTAALLLSACDSQSTDVETQVVLSAFLEAGAPMPTVTLSRTVPIGEFYDPAAAGISDATVEVQLLGTDGSVEQSYPFESIGTPSSRFSGAYEAVRDNGALPEVLAGRTYRIVAEALGQALTAQTRVPATFDIVEAPPSEIIYQSIPNGPPLQITTSSVSGRQSVYIVSSQALAADTFDEFTRDGETLYRSRNEPGTFRPVPFVQLFLDCDDESGFLVCGFDPTDASSGSSPIINESSYRLLGDGTAIVDLPWIAFGFYGPAQVALIALDDAFQDFVETQAVQGGGTTLSPGEIPNVTSNVVGGLGVFGSFAQQTVRITVLER